MDYVEDPSSWSLEKLRRKADQEFEMAGMASRDGDTKAAAAHTAKAKEYDRIRKELQC